MMSKKNLTYMDLFAGDGGLSEGFIRQWFIPFAHSEMDI
jgi:DNA (cytosine-5)-methyltransferase 1